MLKIIHEKTTSWVHGMELPTVNPHTVIEVQCDGDELIRLWNGVDSASSIRWVRWNDRLSFPKIMRWFGDDAKWIVGNLQEIFK